MRIFRSLWCGLFATGVLLLLSLPACAPPPPVLDLQAAGVQSLQLESVTVGDVALLPSERTRVATTLKAALQKELTRRGYRLLQTNADAVVTVHIDYVRDLRVHHTYWWDRAWPELELYATFRLTNARGDLLTEQEVMASGDIPAFGEPGNFEYLEPQQNLARKIARRFPQR